MTRALSALQQRLSLEVVGIAIALAVIWLLTILSPLPPDDLWYHLALGREVVEQGAIPATNQFSYSVPADRPYHYSGWLGKAALYLANELGGVGLLALLRAVAVTAGYGLLAVVVRRASGGSGGVCLTALLASALLGYAGWGQVAQSLALPLLAASLLVLDGYASGAYRARTLIALPLLCLLWANWAEGFVLGPLLLLAYLLGIAAEKSGREQRPVVPGLLPLLLALPLTLGAALINPYGPEIFSGPLLPQGSGPDWLPAYQPPATGADMVSNLFFASLLAQPLLWRWRGRRPSLPLLVSLLLLAWIAFSAWRAIIWYAMALAPLLAQALRPAQTATRPAGPAARLLLAALPALALAGLPWLHGGRLLRPAEQVVAGPAAGYSELLSQDTPVAAVEALRLLQSEGEARGHLFHDVRFGSYLSWALPEEQIFVDTRVALYDKAIWDDYRDINELCNYAEILERYDIRRMLLDRRQQQPLIAELLQQDGWELHYEDSSAVVVVRR